MINGVQAKRCLVSLWSRIYRFLVKRKVSWGYLTFIILILFSSVQFVPESPTTVDLQLSMPGQYVYINDYSTTWPYNLAGEVLGMTFSLNWFNVCLTNGSYISDGKSKFSVPLSLTIHPFETNALLSGLTATEEDNLIIDANSTTGKGDIYMTTIDTLPGGTTCHEFPSLEHGFSYDNLILRNFKNKYDFQVLGDIDQSGILPLENGYDFYSGGTTLQVTPNTLALWMKRILFILLLWGFCESVKKIFCLIFPRRKV